MRGRRGLAEAPEGPGPPGPQPCDPERWRALGTGVQRRLESWAEILAATHISFDVHETARTPLEFQGAVMRRRLGPLMLVDCAASPFLGSRRSTMISPAAENENILGFQFVCKGVELVRESNREVALRPGDVVLWDGLQPTEVEIVEPFYKRTLMFPRDEVLALCPRLAEADALPALDPNGPARLLVRYMNALALELPQLEVGARIAAATAAFELLTLGLAGRAYVMEGGRIRYDGPAKELREQPELLHSAYLFRGAPTGNGAPAPTVVQPT